MCQYPLFETLAIIDGKIQNIEFHQQRLDYAMKNYFHSNQAVTFLSKFAIPTQFQQGLVRCRLDYNASDFEVNFYPYNSKKIQTFQCIYTQDLDYQFKYADRQKLDNLKNSNCDEIIIINNGFISDCTIGNLLFLKENQWYCSNHYLLKGTQLSSLISQQKVQLIEIKCEDIFGFEKIMMINALNPFDENRTVLISKDTIKI
ncbi:Branched-chain amino acid aminotransferase/4-amino-4-deoxychorismate lyase [Phocoenobacter uteri]|uniref:Branched-chain amino acid aminotransferase/4-amino-4-deoxychorismate lyase n=1 Tax=Phocoenobacter uteri TaxID=146806 RepID=A0A379C8H6_9PAST|nr:aminotransferase class IV family protein [Phocoenobacter uteri]MDG6882452.1 branched-chain amino acid aminotransferase [Phocoenobacter uteri]SUB58613.1 Branched-chain amino acid aminotransferase/4-amino-4-deoxychorismate lyase [Phocoenobacter uteri]